MRATLRVSLLARADIAAIARRIAEDSSRGRAIAYTTAMQARMARLADFPESAQLRPEYGEGVRALPYGRFLLLYRWETAHGRILVLRVVAAAQQARTLE